ncbi:tat pathway signal sequence protein [Rutstroemia sp. NJR-2017a BVV2]|nr:tat pathway signal sequence protein [Rutstroemia sp. NJR-2017a BVV2]
MYKDIYDDVQSWTPTHVDHCIDSIRQNLMCNADTAMMGFRWVNDSLEPKPNFRGQHECVNWERIEEWASERSFNPDDQANLRHPSAA